METIGKMNDWPLSLESLEMHGKSYLMVQARNSAEVFVQEGNGLVKRNAQVEGIVIECD